MNYANILAHWSYKISKFFVYVALITPAIVTVSLFFPFISGKVLFFRIIIQLAGLFFFIYLILSPREIRASLRSVFKQPMFIAVTFFVAIFLLTAITGINFQNSFFSNFERGDGAFQMLHLYVFFFLLFVMFKTKADWINLMKLSLVVSLYISIYAIGQKLQLSHEWLRSVVIGGGGRPSGTLGNPSYLSVYALFHILFALLVIFREKALWQKIVWLSILLLNVYALMNAQTRGTIIGFIFALFVALIVLSFAKRPQVSHNNKKGKNNTEQTSVMRDTRWAFRAILILTILLGVFFLSTRATLNFWTEIPGINRFVDAQFLDPLQDSSFRSRYLTWTSAMAGALERPVLGWGAENFPYVFDRYYNPLRFGGESWFDRAHNFVFDYLSSGGILLLAAYMGMFFIFYRETIRGSYFDAKDKNAKIPPLKKPYVLYIGFLTLPVAYMVQNLFLFDVLAIYMVLFMFFALTAHLLSSFSLIGDFSNLEESKYSLGIFRIALIVLFTGLVGVMIYTTNYLPYKKNILLREGLALEASRPFDIMSLYDKTLKFYSPVGQAETVERLGSSVANFFVMSWQRNQRLKPEIAVSTIDFANGVYNYAKENGYLISVKPLFLYGVANYHAAIAFNNLEYLNNAKLIMEEGHEMAPFRLEFVLGLMDIAMLQRDAESLEKMLEWTKALRPDLDNYSRYEGALKEIKGVEIDTNE